MSACVCRCVRVCVAVSALCMCTTVVAILPAPELSDFSSGTGSPSAVCWMEHSCSSSAEAARGQASVFSPFHLLPVPYQAPWAPVSGSFLPSSRELWSLVYS